MYTRVGRYWNQGLFDVGIYGKHANFQTKLKLITFKPAEKCFFQLNFVFVKSELKEDDVC